MTPRKHLPENYMAAFVGDVNDGKSFQCDSAMEARAADGSHIIDGAVWISTETSTSGTAKCWADVDRVLVVRCTSAKEVLAAIRKYLPVPAASDAAPRLPSGRRIDALICDSITGVFRSEQSIVRAELRAVSEGDSRKKNISQSSNQRQENDERAINKHAASRTCEVVDAIHSAAAAYGLLALVTCHDADAFVDVEEINPATGKREKVPEWIGRRLDVSASVVKKLRAAANAIWYMHAVLPNFTGMDAGLVNKQRRGDNPKTRRRYAAITDRGTYPGKIGDLGDVCKRQGDGEGTPWQQAFGAAVPTWWHPDFVAAYDPEHPEAAADVPCLQPHFGKILELACSSADT